MSKPFLSNKPILISKLNNYPKIKCAFHSSKILTNFCLCQQCLLPLCPECVKLHSQQHQLSYTHGKFETYNQCLSIVEKNYLNYIQQTKILMKSVQQSYQRKTKDHKSIKQSFKQSKAKVIQEVNNVLRIYEDQLDDHLNNEMKQFRHSLEDLQNSVSWIVGSSRKALQNLYTSSSAQTIIQFYSQQATKIQNLLLISSKIQVNPNILYHNFILNTKTLSQIRNIIFNSINILDKLNYTTTDTTSQIQQKDRKGMDSSRRYHKQDTSRSSVLENFDLRKYRQEKRNIYMNN